MTYPEVLTNIESDNGIFTMVALIVSPWPIYDGLKRNESVRALQKAWEDRQIDPEVVESYIGTILQDFQPGFYLSREYVLCALCVALEPFKDEATPLSLISNCAKCHFTETPMLGSVASFCLNGDPYAA